MSFLLFFGHAVLVPRALVVSPEGLRVAAHPDPAVTAEMLRGLLDVRLAGDQARDHGAGDQAARDHDVAHAALRKVSRGRSLLLRPEGSAGAAAAARSAAPRRGEETRRLARRKKKPRRAVRQLSAAAFSYLRPHTR